MSDATNLLRQAMADAKQVRETAIANAKQMLEEQFSPQLRSMISENLQKEAINPGSSNIAGGSVTVKDPAPTKPSADTSSSSGANGEGSEVLAFGEGPVVEALAFGEGPVVEAGMPGEEDEFGLGGDVSLDAAPDGAGGVDMNLDMDPAAMGGAGMAPGAPGPDAFGGAPDQFGHEDELDLEAIIRELELDTQDPNSPNSGEAHDGFGNDEGGRDDFQKNYEGFDDAMAGAKVDGPVTIRRESTDGVPNGKEVKPGTPVTDDANGNSKDGKGAEAHDGFGKKDGGKKVTPGQEVTEELDLDEILREIEAEDSSSMDESEKIAAENAELKEEIKKYRAGVKFLQTKLHEINQMNSKLLFTNKLFKAFNLDGQAKMRVIETFDRATTLREVKMAYAILAESLKARKGGKKGATALTEGMSGKVMGSTKPRSDASILTEEEVKTARDVARLQKIAGISILKG